MSTKIYNGYKLPCLRLNELQAFAIEFRKKVDSISKSQFESLLAREITHKIDEISLMDKESYAIKYSLKKGRNRNPYNEVFTNIEERYEAVQRTNIRDREVDFDSNVTLIPIHDSILALFYAENGELINLWEAEPLVGSYGYWNNADPEEGCTEEEWLKRKEDWEEALPGYTAPIEVGFSFDFSKGMPNRFSVDFKKVDKYFPTFEERVMNNARDTVLNHKIELFQKEGKRPYQSYAEASTWVKETEEGRRALQEEVERMEKLLIPKISSDFYLTDYDALKEKIDNKN